VNDSLQHVGVLGMHWGSRNGSDHGLKPTRVKTNSSKNGSQIRQEKGRAIVKKVLLTGLSAAAIIGAYKASGLVQQKWIEHLVKDVRLTDILDVSLH